MRLAINGGKPIREFPFSSREIPGSDKDNIKYDIGQLLNSYNLSGYRGSFGQHFWGGHYVRRVEKFFEDYLFNKNHQKYYVLAVNSCTSALQIACGAIGLEQFDEVIVTPWSMTCSATAPMVYGAKPVFADIEKDYFCLDPESVESKITDKTKAIIAVDLFGQPYEVDKINAIAKEHNLYVIEDAAQAIGSTYDGKQAGTLGDIGCFSFTQGKHFTCGEGGFIVTQNEELYYKCALIRNHAEAVINSMPFELQNKFYNMKNQHGFNMRMTEMQAIFLYYQLQHLDEEVKRRVIKTSHLSANIQIPGIEWAKVREGSTHSYYVLPFLFDEEKVGVSRTKFIEAVKAELRVEQTNMGVTQKLEPLIWERYITPIYQMPIFKYNSHYNTSCPVAEDLNENKFCMTSYQAIPLSGYDEQDIINAFYKVYNNIGELRNV